MKRSTLLATVTLPLMLLQFSPAFALPLLKMTQHEHAIGFTRIAMSVDEAQAQLDAALAALEDAKANGGDVEAAQAAVDAAQAALSAAQEPVAEPAPEVAPEPQAEPVPEPAPDAAPAEPAPEPKAVEPEPQPEPPAEPAPDAAPEQTPAPDVAPAEPTPEPPAVEPVPEHQAEPAPDVAPEPQAEPEQPPAPDVAPAEPTPEPPSVEPTPAEPPAVQPDAPPTPEAAPEPLPNADPAPTPESKPADAPVTNEPAAPAADAPAPTEAQKADPTAPAEVQPAADAQATVDPVKIEENKKIAADPAKTTETIVLPVANGAAVLDSDKEADTQGSGSSRKERQQQRAEVKALPAPTSDAQAQAAPVGGSAPAPVKIQPVDKVVGQKIEQAPVYIEQNNVTVQTIINNRTIINVDNQVVVKSDDRDRLERNSESSFYEQLPKGRVRETIVKADSSRIVTIRNRFGDIIQRSVISPDGEEFVLFYSPELDRGRAQQAFVDPGDELPPMRLVVPLPDYIIDTSSQPNRDYGAFLRKPPVERVERVYSLDEVKYSARIRDKVRRIDLDTITFASGSADISLKQANSLKSVAKAIRSILAKDPGETFLIEGHTDAVGSYQSNLVLSDLRAESVANILTDVFDIPAENLATQGYGERYLKVITEASEEQNRRVTIRRVTALVRPVAAR